MEWEWQSHLRMKRANPNALHILVALTLWAPQSFAVNSDLARATTTVFHTNKVEDVNDYPAAKCKKEAVTDKKGQVLARLCADDFERCRVEGSCLVHSDKGDTLINVTGSGSRTFDKVDQKTCKYGTGSMVNGKRSCLIPYKTVACDKSVKPGTVFHIPEAVGKHYQVEGGPMQVHDGNFICADTGSKIAGNCRFDIFTGFKGKNDAKNEFLLAGFDDKNTKSHCAQVIGGKLAEDDHLIKNLQNLVLTSGDTPAPGAVAENQSGSAGAR